MGELPTNFGFQELLGFEIDDSPSEARVAIDLQEQHFNPNGVAHGGIAYALMDTAMGRATMSALAEGQICATVEMHVRYFRGVVAGRLVATATIINLGRRIVHLEARTTDGDDRLIATATSSYAVLDAPS